MVPDQRCERIEVTGGDPLLPMRLCQDLLDHQGVYVDHTVLEQMQCQHADFVILPAVAGHFTAPREEDKIIGTIPLLDNIQPVIDFTAQFLAVQIAAQEDRLDRLPKLGERPVGWMLDVAPGEAAKNGVRFSGPEADGSDIFDHLVILLADDFLVDRLGQHRLQVSIGVGLSNIGPIELLDVDPLQTWHELETQKAAECKSDCALTM